MVSKLYVGNLGSGAAKHEIESAFVKFGPLRNVWVARNPPGFAFVEYDDPRDAEDAVRALDGTRMCGTRVRVEMSNGRSRRGGRRGPPPQRALVRLLRHLFKAIDRLVHQNYFPLYCLSVRIVRQIGLATTFPFTAAWEGIKSCASTPASNQIYSPSLTTAQPSNPIPTCGPP